MVKSDETMGHGLGHVEIKMTRETQVVQVGKYNR